VAAEPDTRTPAAERGRRNLPLLYQEEDGPVLSSAKPPHHSFQTHLSATRRRRKRRLSSVELSSTPLSKPHTGYSIERTNWIRQNERHLIYAFDLCNKVSLMRLVAAAARFEADPQLVARLVCAPGSLAGVGLLSAVSRAANFARFASVPSSKRSMLLSLAIFSSRLRARAAFAIFRAILFAFLSSRVVSGLPCSGVIRFPLRVADTFMLLFNSGPKRIVAKSAAVHPSPTPRPPKDASPPSRTRRRRGRPWPPPVAWCRLGVERCVCVVLCFLDCAACLRLVQGCPESACHPG
jgi:hypothetical protein